MPMAMPALAPGLTSDDAVVDHADPGTGEAVGVGVGVAAVLCYFYYRGAENKKKAWDDGKVHTNY